MKTSTKLPLAASAFSNRGLLDLIALAKPRILVMVLVTAAGGYWLAAGGHDLPRLSAVLVGIGLVVSGANALNMYLERDTDGYMARTRNRPLPAGRLSAATALWFGIALAACGLPILLLAVNALTGALAAAGLFLYVFAYTPLKRYSSFALLVGAVPGAVPPLVGWTGATGSLELPGLVLFGILFLWQVPHFLAISLFRESEYARAGLQLLPIEINESVAKHQIVVYLMALVPVSLLLFTLEVAGIVYLIVAGVLGLLFLVWGLLGLRSRAGERWARQLFVVSLVYLTGLFAGLVADRLLL